MTRTYGPDDPVLYWQDGVIANIRFNRPQSLNAIDLGLAEGFAAVCQDIAKDRDIRTVLVSGEGRAFMAGGDVQTFKNFGTPYIERLIDTMHAAIEQFSALRVPVIAKVHGAVAGAGVGIMLASDFVVADESTKVSLAYSRLGATFDCGTSWHLVRTLGQRMATELSMLGEVVTAAKALELGLVNQIADADSFDQVADALVRRLAAGPTISFAQTRGLIRGALHRDLSTQLAAEKAAFLSCAGTNDFAEAVDAFLERREARFRGH